MRADLPADAGSEVPIPPDVPRLSLRPREAAAALGISTRLLWTLTNKGEIPVVRLGEKRLVYPVAMLTAWLADQARKGGPR